MKKKTFSTFIFCQAIVIIEASILKGISQIDVSKGD